MKLVGRKSSIWEMASGWNWNGPAIPLAYIQCHPWCWYSGIELDGLV